MFTCSCVWVDASAFASFCIMWVEIARGVVPLKEGVKLDAVVLGRFLVVYILESIFMMLLDRCFIFFIRGYLI